MICCAVDRPGLRGVQLVEKLQASISRCLQAAVSASHSTEPSTFAKLLIKVSDLRTLNTIHSEKLLGITFLRVLFCYFCVCEIFIRS